MYSYDHREGSHNIMVQASVRTPLYGHDDMKSAYVVDDYPYGFKLRTQIRYWLEYKPGKGYRFVSQTLNPKNGQWNKPKASTYMEIAGAMYLDEKGHVQWTGVGVYTDEAKILEFVKDFPRADTKLLKIWVNKKISYLTAMLEGKAYFTINNVRKDPSEEDIGRYRKELEIWQEIARQI